MALEVIGSGFGRTGTRSMKAALEQLGLGPCHHMEEVFANPPQVDHWERAISGDDVDWDQVFDGYRSQVDWPGCHFWRELSEAYPDAKIVHTQRPEEKWWASFAETIGKLLGRYEHMPVPPHVRRMLDVGRRVVAEETFGGNWTDRDTAIAAYRNRLDKVRDAVPADRLLVFDVADGWEPLCSFLGLPVPDRPFPHLNVKTEFWEVLGGEPT